MHSNNTDKVDPSSLPLSVKDSNLMRMKSESGVNSLLGIKSTITNNKANSCAKGGSSTDETLSNQGNDFTQ